MSKILAIETATEACSAAVILDDHTITERFQLAPREHTKLLLPMMEEVLKEAGVTLNELDAIAFSCGPGAFTGLRIAAGVAQGAALAIDKPVIPVSTLFALAMTDLELADEDIIVSALDARMGEVYWGMFCYRGNEIIALADECVSKPQEMMKVAQLTSEDKPGAKIYAIGTGWDAYADPLFENGKPDNLNHVKNVFPKAEHVAKLAVLAYLRGEAVPPEEAQPVYIRNKVAEKSKTIKK